MTTPTSPPESAPASGLDEDRLGQALITRGLVTPEELAQGRSPDGAKGKAEALLGRLVKANLLTPNQARRIAQEMAFFVGQQIPGYQLLEKLGQGSMGVVYKARQLSMNRLVALKVLQSHLAAVPRERDRFLHEAHLAAKLSHNNIIGGIDAGSAGNIHYFVMEYVEGTPVSQMLENGKILGEREALEIIIQIAHGLEHAQGRGLIHRDIKPANIVITTEGVAKLADLGLARQMTADAAAKEEQGVIRGTPFYIAPEQIRGKPDVDIRADIYSLGATLYHMVTGKPPFRGKTVRAIFDGHLKEDLVPPDHLNTALSSGLGEVVEFMMAKDRDKRYRTPRELILDLESLLAGEPPRLARQRIQADTLKGLTEGEVADDEEKAAAAPGVSPAWVVMLGILLALSVLLNLVLALRN